MRKRKKTFRLKRESDTIIFKIKHTTKVALLVIASAYLVWSAAIGIGIQGYPAWAELVKLYTQPIYPKVTK